MQEASETLNTDLCTPPPDLVDIPINSNPNKQTTNQTKTVLLK